MMGVTELAIKSNVLINIPGCLQWRLFGRGRQGDEQPAPSRCECTEIGASWGGGEQITLVANLESAPSADSASSDTERLQVHLRFRSNLWLDLRKRKPSLISLMTALTEVKGSPVKLLTSLSRTSSCQSRMASRAGLQRANLLLPSEAGIPGRPGDRNSGDGPAGRWARRPTTPRCPWPSRCPPPAPLGTAAVPANHRRPVAHASASSLLGPSGTGR